MKTKIIVSSSSSINYINHSLNIISLPEIIKFGDNEEYLDYEQIEYDEFYLRYSNDNNIKPTFEALSILEIKKIIDKTIQTCDKLVIVLNSDDKISSLKSLLAGYKGNVYLYETDAFGYILANMVIELEKKLNKEEIAIENALKQINEIKKNSFNIILNYDNDYTVGDIKNNNIDYKMNKTSFYYYNTSGKSIKNERQIEKLIRIFFESIDNKNGIPFIEFSHDDSALVDYLENILLSKSKFKTIKKIPFSPATGIKYGANIISLGFIRGEDK